MGGDRTQVSDSISPVINFLLSLSLSLLLNPVTAMALVTQHVSCFVGYVLIVSLFHLFFRTSRGIPKIASLAYLLTFC
jgi:hypothetical protein